MTIQARLFLALFIALAASMELHATPRDSSECITTETIQRLTQDPPVAVSQVPDLSRKSLQEARTLVEAQGFRPKGQTAGGYEQWAHPDGSTVWFRPNGEVVRTGPKIRSQRTGKMFSPRFDQRGQRTQDHNTGEFIALPQ